MSTGRRSQVGQKQHVDMFRKVRLRQRFLSDKPDGLAYVPFIGDGDIALETLQGYSIWGADLDPARVKVAQSRLPDSRIKVADCDIWPFPEEEFPGLFSVGDFDSYAYPYHSFRSWFENAPLADRLVVFFTDAQLNYLGQRKQLTLPDGTNTGKITLAEARKYLNFYLRRTLLPWLTDYSATKGYEVSRHHLYKRSTMVYWGAVLERN